MPDLREWVDASAPPRTKRIFNEYLAARDPSEIPMMWLKTENSASQATSDSTGQPAETDLSEGRSERRLPPFADDWEPFPEAPKAHVSSPAPSVTTRPAGSEPSIFIVHGHDTSSRDSIRIYVEKHEATALRIRDIDFPRNRVNVVENAVLVSGEVIVGTPKTYKRRAVPYPALLTPALRDATQGRESGDLVFPDRFGTYQTTPTIKLNSWLDRALDSAGLPPMTIHDLRHTTASLAISAGANVKAVQKMLGHASAAMTLDIYADLFDDDLNDVATRLNDAARHSSVSKLVNWK